MRKLFLILCLIPAVIFAQSVSTSIKTDKIYSKVGRGISLYDTVFIKKGIAADSLENIEGIVCRNSSDGRLVYVSFAQFVDSIGGASISGDTVFVGGDTLVIYNHWTKTGDDIENNNAGDVTLNGQVFVPDIAASGAKYSGNVAGIRSDDGLFPKSIIEIHDEMQDSLAKTPTVYTTWIKDTTNGAIFQATLTDKVGIGTTNPVEMLDVAGAIKLAGERKNKPSLVFTDDDGWVEVYDSLFPIFQNYNIAGCLALNSTRHIPNPLNINYLTLTQIREFVDAGWEILNHSNNHQHIVDVMHTYGIDSAESAIYQGQKMFLDSGFQVNSYCYAFNEENDTIRSIVKKYHRSALGRASDTNRILYENFDSAFNYQPYRTYQLVRMFFDNIDWTATADYDGQFPVDTSKNYIYFKRAIDTAMKYGYNIQMEMHSRFDALDSVSVLGRDGNHITFWQLIPQILDYAIDSVGIDILTQNEFMDQCGNLIDIGDPKTENDWFAVSATGQISRMDLSNENVIIGQWANAWNDPYIKMTSIGYLAGANSSISYQDSLKKYQTMVGYMTGYRNTRGGFVGIGSTAGYQNTGLQATLAGVSAGYNNSGNYLTAAGYQSAYNNTGSYVTAFGNGAASGNTQPYVTAIGYNAALSNTKTGVTAIGGNALNGNTGTGPHTVVGYWSGRDNTGSNLTAIGYYAGRQNTGTNLTALGNSAGYQNTGNNCIIIGNFSGSTANATANIFLLGSRSANTTPLLTGDLANNRLGIGISKPLADYTLDVAGTGFFSDDLTLDDNMAFVGAGQISTTGNGTMKLDVGTGKVDISGDLDVTGSIIDIDEKVTAGYTLPIFVGGLSSPADATTYYFGSIAGTAPSTTATERSMYIPKSGTIKYCQLSTNATTAGSNEAWPIYIRLNNTTDYGVDTVSTNTNLRMWESAALNIAVTAGDYIEIKTITPTWVTNPAVMTFGGYIYIEQ